ncbi:T6SS immunity protein Tli4 family protein [Pseudomonas sp. NPDC090233]|uniref:T6SS immunity protein Tli4 family protein n=1 Tax=Pseudomonas sp. NPDC090233 TaxID=3364479 RepID=UPI00383BB327
MLNLKSRRPNNAEILIIFTAMLLMPFSAAAQSATESASRFYFGRFTFEAPSISPEIWSAYKIGDKKIELITKNGKKEIENKITTTINEINKLHESGYPAYDQTVKLEGGGAVVVSKSTDYTFDIFYLTAKNTAYKQHVELIDFDSFDKAMSVVRQINSSIHVRPPASKPPTKTFALEAGYLDIPLDKFPEQVSIGLPITSKPGIHLTFDTQIIGVPEEGLITRYEKRSSGVIMPLLKSVLSRTTLLRKSKKSIAGLPFEELLLKSNADGKTLYSFRLEYPGTPESSLEPYTVLELSTVEGGPGFKNDEEALGFWDELLGTFDRI